MRSHPLLALAVLVALGAVATAAAHLASASQNLTYRAALTKSARSHAAQPAAPTGSPTAHFVRLETAPVPLEPVSWTPRFVVVSSAARPALRRAAAAHGTAGGVWAQLRICESGGDYTMDSGNGYYGAYQFSATTWRSIGFRGLPDEATPATQDLAAFRLAKRSGWSSAWPVCSARLGLY